MCRWPRTASASCSSVPAVATTPLTCLWAFDLTAASSRLLADPARLAGDDEDLPPEERARRERLREQAGGIVDYATDKADEYGRLRPVGPALGHQRSKPGRSRSWRSVGPFSIPGPTPPEPRLAYVSGGALRVVGADGRDDRAVIEPDGPECNLRFGRVRGRRGDGPDPGLLVVTGR